LEEEIGGRIAGGLDHPRPFHYLLMTYWPLFFPWSLLALGAAWRAARGGIRRAGEATFLVLWGAGVLLFFSVPADKNDAYLLPAAPPVALLCAGWLPRRLTAAVSLAAGAGLLALLVLAGPDLGRSRSLKEAVSRSGLDRPGAGPILSYRMEKPSLVHYARSPVPVRVLRSGDELRRALDEAPGVAPLSIVMTRERHRRLPRDLRERLGTFRLVQAGAGHVVLRKEAADQLP
ncbi:MAG TPA: hypothetical protein VJV23_08050, partial [Candidatus Polarisedimenticolia bacterium]|nr:hypothetical protein [Candidatus Polarisedimenticolia bacterium]